MVLTIPTYDYDKSLEKNHTPEEIAGTNQKIMELLTGIPASEIAIRPSNNKPTVRVKLQAGSTIPRHLSGQEKIRLTKYSD